MAALLHIYPTMCMDMVHTILRGLPPEMQKSSIVRYQVGLIMARFIMRWESVSPQQNNLFLEQNLLITIEKYRAQQNQLVQQAIRRRIAHYYKNVRKK